jgi:hypothetical protein
MGVLVGVGVVGDSVECGVGEGATSAGRGVKVGGSWATGEGAATLGKLSSAGSGLLTALGGAGWLHPSSSKQTINPSAILAHIFF